MSGGEGALQRLRFRAMGCPCQIWVHGDAAAEIARQAQAEILRLEAKFSRYRDDSVLSRINAAAGADWVDVDPETEQLLDYAAVAWEQSGGLFDITSGILRRAWDFRSQRLPNSAEIQALLPLIGWRLVEREAGRLRLPHAGMELDFGGFGKEYAVDAARALCAQAGLRHGLIDLGGDIAIIGPQPDGAPWRVGISDPASPGRARIELPMAGGCLATSGNYQRYLIADGVRYCHLLAPSTGWPAQGSYAGVSVLAEQCLIAGTASTVAMLQPAPQAAEWLDSVGLPYLWIDAQGRCGGPLGAQGTEIPSLLPTNR